MIDPAQRREPPVEVTARLLNAVLAEAALLLVDAPQRGRQRLRRDLRLAVRSTVGGLVEQR